MEEALKIKIVDTSFTFKPSKKSDIFNPVYVVEFTDKGEVNDVKKTVPLVLTPETQEINNEMVIYKDKINAILKQGDNIDRLKQEIIMKELEAKKEAKKEANKEAKKEEKSPEQNTINILNRYERKLVLGNGNCLLYSVLYCLSNLNSSYYSNYIKSIKGVTSNALNHDVAMEYGNNYIYFPDDLITILRRKLYDKMDEDYKKNLSTEKPNEKLLTHEYLTETHIGILCEFFKICIVLYTPYSEYGKIHTFKGYLNPEKFIPSISNTIYIRSNYNHSIGNQETDHYEPMVSPVPLRQLLAPQSPAVVSEGQNPAVVHEGQNPDVVHEGQNPAVVHEGQNPDVVHEGQNPDVVHEGQNPDVSEVQTGTPPVTGSGEDKSWRTSSSIRSALSSFLNLFPSSNKDGKSRKEPAAEKPAAEDGSTITSNQSQKNKIQSDESRQDNKSNTSNQSQKNKIHSELSQNNKSNPSIKNNSDSSPKVNKSNPSQLDDSRPKVNESNPSQSDESSPQVNTQNQSQQNNDEYIKYMIGFIGVMALLT